MKLVKKLLLVSLMLIPTIIFAGTAENMELFPEILVMNEGDIIEQGSHEELLKKDGFYKKLYNSQFELTEE